MRDNRSYNHNDLVNARFVGAAWTLGVLTFLAIFGMFLTSGPSEKAYFDYYEDALTFAAHDIERGQCRKITKVGSRPTVITRATVVMPC